MLKKFLILCLLVSFSLTTVITPIHASDVIGLPAPGKMVNLSAPYNPVLVKGLTIHQDNPFLFDFLVDVGEDNLSGQALKEEGEKLIKYFLAALTIPSADLWVNLSPYEKDKLVPEALGQTDMGRDLLAQDYVLKQMTASMIYPENELGKKFWDKVYAKSQQLYGTTQIPINTFNKVWIIADRAEVFERNQTAFVVDQHLKVMLEEDYLALKKNDKSATSSSLKEERSVASIIIRDVILPELEKEVNSGKNFANLRQMFNSIILANWYKKNLKKALLNQTYANQSKVKGIDLSDTSFKALIYEQYLKAYKKGVFNYIKDESNKGQVTPRKYFSGGVLGAGAAADPAITADQRKLAQSVSDRALVAFQTGLTFSSEKDGVEDAAMIAIRGKSLAQKMSKEIASRKDRQISVDVIKSNGDFKRNHGVLLSSLKEHFDKEEKVVIKDGKIDVVMKDPDALLWGKMQFTIEVEDILWDGLNLSLADMWDNSRFNRENSSALRIDDQWRKLFESAPEIIALKQNATIDELKVSVQAILAGADFPSMNFLSEFVNQSDENAVRTFIELMQNPKNFDRVVRILRINLIDIGVLFKQEEIPVDLNSPQAEMLATMHRLFILWEQVEKASSTDAAMKANSVNLGARLPQANAFPGGIDLNTDAKTMQWKEGADGQGVQMNVDVAMIERIKREGINWLSPTILKITPVVSIWPLVGLKAPEQSYRMAKMNIE